jgi:hypothetical protein
VFKLLKKYNPKKVNKMTFAEDAQLKQEMFLSLKPAERLQHSEELAKKIWGKKYRYRSLKGVKVRKRRAEL